MNVSCQMISLAFNLKWVYKIYCWSSTGWERKKEVVMITYVVYGGGSESYQYLQSDDIFCERILVMLVMNSWNIDKRTNEQQQQQQKKNISCCMSCPIKNSNKSKMYIIYTGGIIIHQVKVNFLISGSTKLGTKVEKHLCTYSEIV